MKKLKELFNKIFVRHSSTSSNTAYSICLIECIPKTWKKPSYLLCNFGPMRHQYLSDGDGRRLESIGIDGV